MEHILVNMNIITKMFKRLLLLLLLICYIKADIKIIRYPEPGSYVLTSEMYQNASEMIVEAWGAGGGLKGGIAINCNENNNCTCSNAGSIIQSKTNINGGYSNFPDKICFTCDPFQDCICNCEIYQYSILILSEQSGCAPYGATTLLIYM